MPQAEKCTCKFRDDYILLKGDQIEFELRKEDCEIRADVHIKQLNYMKIWGEVENCKSEPIEGALVKLIKVKCQAGKNEYEGVAYTETDCKGFYQFEIYQTEFEDSEEKEKAVYRIMVFNAETPGQERIMCGCDCEPYSAKEDYLSGI